MTNTNTRDSITIGSDLFLAPRDFKVVNNGSFSHPRNNVASVYDKTGALVAAFETVQVGDKTTITSELTKLGFEKVKPADHGVHHQPWADARRPNAFA